MNVGDGSQYPLEGMGTLTFRERHDLFSPYLFGVLMIII